MSIYSQLLDRGYTHEDLVEATTRDKRGGTRTFTLVMSESEDVNPGGDPLVGISYRNDYRYEEEAGIGKIKTAMGVTGANGWMVTREGARNRIAVLRLPEGDEGYAIAFTEKPVMFLNTWGDDIRKAEGPRGWDPTLLRGSSYVEHYEDNLDHAQGYETDWALFNKRVPELKELAKAEGVSLKGIRLRADIEEAIKAHRRSVRVAKSPNTYPGYFHYGDVLVLRAGAGVVADVLRMLMKAALDGTLAFGSGGFGPFASGTVIYDGADVSKQEVKNRKRAAKWYNKQMAKVGPVLEYLKEKHGQRPYFLGNPRVGFEELVDSNAKDGRRKVSPTDVYYWLNGSSIRKPDRSYVQPYGWYTLDDLRAGKYLTDKGLEVPE